MTVLHRPEIFAVAAVAGISDPRLHAADSRFGFKHQFQLSRYY
jgi:hypothetical protein